MNEQEQDEFMQMAKRGRPRCPCGYIGASRTIRRHRIFCKAWPEWTKRFYSVEKSTLSKESSGQ